MLKFLIGQGRWLCRERTVGCAPRTPAGRACSPSAPLGAMHGRAVAPRPPLGRVRAPRAPQWIATICTFSALALTALADDPTISVSAQQRYPWNGLVDVHFTITGDAGKKYDTSFTAKDMVGNTNIAMRTIRKADGTAAAAKEQLLPGTYNWVWDAAADLPKDWQCDRLTVTGTAVEHIPLYMVIDLSSGSSSSSYPVSYLDAVPSGGWGDAYKKTKLVLRRIDPGPIPTRNATITKPYFCGIFEVTQKQVELVMGSSVIQTHVYHKGDMRPFENGGNYSVMRGSTNGAKWPSSSAVDSTSFMGKMRARTGLDFDLPTAAQWEYACRAGTTSSYNNGGNSESDLKKVGRYTGNQSDGKGGYSQHTKVGSYQANAWGLYDMNGNVWEWCLDWNGGSISGDDPVGPASGSYRVLRGGSWDSGAGSCKTTSTRKPDTESGTYKGYGFRVICRLAN